MDIQEIIYEEGTQEKEFREKGSRGKKNKKTESQQKVTYDGIRKDPEIHLLIEKGNEMLGILGYTEHSVKHAAKVAKASGDILKKLGYGKRVIELSRIAGTCMISGTASIEMTMPTAERFWLISF